MNLVLYPVLLFFVSLIVIVGLIFFAAWAVSIIERPNK